MIVDDIKTIIGSANLNDRSQKGTGDSEVCCLFTDYTKEFGQSLRVRLWSTYLGKCEREFREVRKDNNNKTFDPKSDHFFNQIWNSTKNSNTKKLDQVFKCIPNNQIHSFEGENSLDEFISNEYGKRLVKINDENDEIDENDDSKIEQAIEIVNSLEGVLVDYPLEFLKNEWMHPSRMDVFSKEAMAPVATFI